MNGPSSSFPRNHVRHAEASGLRIGEWQVDPATNRLSREGETLHLEPKAMAVLLLLARRAGEVISREELLATVWSGSVVGDDTLTQAVIKLRKALGDDTRSPRYIETIASEVTAWSPRFGQGRVTHLLPAPAAGKDRRRRTCWTPGGLSGPLVWHR